MRNLGEVIKMKLIKSGAEAEIYLKKNSIIKRRINKGYRQAELDSKLINSRTKSEVKILSKLERLGVPVPTIKFSNKSEIEMEYLDGPILKNIIEKNLDLCEKIGNNIALLHKNGIIHGDLTTSNMILKDSKVYFIDLGLGFFSDRIEDKAVDLHLLYQVLESTHSSVANEAFSKILKAYQKNYIKGKEVINRLEKVELRGRYKKN